MNPENETVDLDSSSDTGVEFKEEGWGAIKYYTEPNTPRMVSFIMKYSGGLIQDKKQASIVLLVVVGLFVVVSAFLFFGSKTDQPTSGAIPSDQFIP